MSSRLIQLICIVFLYSGCATNPQRTLSSDSNPTRSTQFTSDSTLDISYILGHNSHRFIAEAKANLIKGQSFMDRQLLKAGMLDHGKYSELLQRVSAFVQQISDTPSQARLPASEGCRSPFTVTLRVGAKTQTARGCRSSDQATDFGKITRDAEYLLYSAK